MATLDNLQTASFKGVKFLIDGDQELESGRKGQMHDYVNSDRRFFEDLGKRPEVFTITAIVHGDDSIQQAERLRRVLDEKGSGILVHPFWGQFEVTNELYTTVTSTKNLGVIRFNMTFKVGETQEIFPATILNNSARIASLTQSAQDAIFTDLARVWSAENLGQVGIDAAREKIQEIITTFEEVANTVFPGVDSLNEFSDFIRVFDQKELSNVFSASELSSDLKNIFTEYQVLAEQPQDQYLLSRRLFDFGDLETGVNPTTIGRLQRENNRKIANQTMQLNSLVQAYGNVPQMTFKTDVDLKTTQDQLDNQFVKVAGEESLFDSTTLEVVKELRTEVRKYFDNERNNVFRITEVETNTVPMTILGYQYYGNTDEVQNLVDLNNSVDVTRVEGEVKIFS